MNKIEQALLNADDLAISEEVDCSDVLAYINELKNKVPEGAIVITKEEQEGTKPVDDEATLRFFIAHNSDLIARTKRDTAKEILKAIAECQTISDVRGKRYNRYELDQKDFEDIADRYGVGVDE